MAKSTKPIVTDDDIQKTKEYAEAIDKLKTSIAGANSALPDFANGLDAGLKSIASKLPDIVNSMTRINTQNKELGESGKKPINVLAELTTSLFSWNNLISVSITLLATYGGTIIRWAADMIKGEASLTALNKALKDNKIVLTALNNVKRQGAQNAQQELYHLNLLYKTSQDSNVKIEERKKIINELQNLYPGYFGTLTTLQILNGKAEESYQKLTKAIEANSRAKVTEDAVTKNKQRQLNNQTQLVQLKSDLKTYTDALKEAQQDYEDIKKGPQVFGSGTVPTTGDSRLSNAANKIYNIKNNIEKTRKLMAGIDEDSRLLGIQNKKMTDAAMTDAEQFGATVFGVSSILNKATGNKPKKTEPQPKDGPDPTKQLELKSISFAKSFDQQQQYYDIEYDALKAQLDKKLITEAEYNAKGQELKEKYHKGIGGSILNYHEIELADTIQLQGKIVSEGRKTLTELEADQKKHNQELKDFELQTTQEVSNAAFSILQNSIKSQSEARIKQLETQKASELNNSSLTATQKKAIEEKYTKKEAEEKTKAFKAEQRASLLQAVINGALAITKATSQTGVLAPFVIPGIIAETAIQVATIAAQKAPQYAKGGVHYQSDGRGALLPGYSRTDNMNAYLRSGEAVVVSEAMRDPWARNLVSAINVAYGGRDFSLANPSRGYAIGGIFTDGGNSNRYYNQPMNDQKDLANTIAYQMINNFPPVYVDVKDINNQQSILAQTVNRVNL